MTDLPTSNIQLELHCHRLDRATQKQNKRDLSCKGSVLQIKCGAEKHAKNCSLWGRQSIFENQWESSVGFSGPRLFWMAFRGAYTQLGLNCSLQAKEWLPEGSSPEEDTSLGRSEGCDSGVVCPGVSYPKGLSSCRHLLSCLCGSFLLFFSKVPPWAWYQCGKLPQLELHRVCCCWEEAECTASLCFSQPPQTFLTRCGGQLQRVNRYQEYLGKPWDRE